MRILVVEDEKNMNKIITQRLELENYCVDSCYDGQAALDYLLLAEYDGVIMDIMLPQMDGYEVLRKMREQGVQTPVMFLSAKDETDDIVKGLDIGADDYMVKPFEFSELMARLRVMMRKQTGVKENVYRCGSLEVDINTQTVTREGKKIALSPKEFAILVFLIRNQNMVVTRQQIEDNIWSVGNETSSNVVDVYIRYLRKKIDADYYVKMIQTIRGVGYILKCDKEEKR